jgi:hypothetical protein
MRERHIVCLEYLCTLMTSSETTFGSATNSRGSDWRLRNSIKNTRQRRLPRIIIGLWFLWDVDTDWLIDQLLNALAAGYAPNDLYMVIGGLSKLDDDKIDRVIEPMQ